MPTDGIASLQTRRSMHSRRSLEVHRVSSGGTGFGTRGDRQGLIHSYDVENGEFGLTDLTEDSDEGVNSARASMNGIPGNKASNHRKVKGQSR